MDFNIGICRILCDKFVFFGLVSTHNLMINLGGFTLPPKWNELYTGVQASSRQLSFETKINLS